MDDYDFFGISEEYTPDFKIDSYFSNVQEEIKKLYEIDKESVYYLRQLQIKFEKGYFHWVTNNALTGLIQLGYLKDYKEHSQIGTSTRFFMHKSYRYPLRKIKRISEIISEYSQDTITRSCGHRAEDLFFLGLAKHGYSFVDEKVNKFNGKKWEKSGHDLDFIFTKEGLYYGCEIKNTLGYIDKEEMEIKTEMCKHLGIIPLFIMRWAPKTYIDYIVSNGGFVLIFETQIYEISQKDLVKRMVEELGIKAICSKAIPDGIINRLDKWHQYTVKKEMKSQNK